MISRRRFVAVGSAGSLLLLAGCGGGGSAKNAPKPSTGGGCTLPQVGSVPSVHDVDPQYGPSIYFSQGSSDCNFPYYTTSMKGTASVAPFMGCTNPLIAGVQATIQDMYLSVVEKLIVSGAGTTGSPYQAVVRTLRLHLAIPHDASGSTQLERGFVFSVGDPTNPTNCSEVFSGEIMVNDPLAADGSNNWTFQITGGTIEILNDYNPIGLIGIQLKNLVATATAAGTGIGSNNSALGTLNMQGTSLVYFDVTGANAS